MRLTTIFFASACSFLIATAAFGQNFPSRPVRIISPFGAGGANDVFARIVAQKLSDRLGQQFIVENRGGAEGRIGAAEVARAAPDGYTLLMLAHTAHTAGASLFKLQYNLEKDFVAITKVASSPIVIVVNKDFPAKSLAEFIALAKAKPGALAYASGGHGGSAHLTMELFGAMAGVKLLHIPYKGAGPMVTDLLSGQIQATVLAITTVLPLIKDGRLRALGVTSAERVPSLPDVPTVAEAGLAGFELSVWHGLVAPAGTPGEIVAKLNAETVAILRIPEIRAALAKQDALPGGNSSAEFAAEIRSEVARWRALIRDAGIKAE